MKKTITYEEALAKSASLCSLSEKCISDIQKKLLSWGINSEDGEKIIGRLLQERYIDENRFAKFFVKDKHRFAKWGKGKIIHSLKEKGISSENIQEAIEQIEEEDYSEQLETLLKAKFKSIKYKNAYDAKAKLIRFGLGRGFEYDAILDAIKKFDIEE
ncbi:MAG: RecX family transcriptional regulator [Paludibacteraceae bacterium]|nr:RecX family transcriptional regulator [Paludibacteraceae bacterium]